MRWDRLQALEFGVTIAAGLHEAEPSLAEKKIRGGEKGHSPHHT